MFKISLFVIFFATQVVYCAISLEAKEYGRIIARDGLNIREAPSLTSKKITTIPYNTEVEIVKHNTRIERIGDRSGYWISIVWHKFTGWVFSPYVLRLSKVYTDSIHKSHIKVRLKAKKMSYINKLGFDALLVKCVYNNGFALNQQELDYFFSGLYKYTGKVQKDSNLLKKRVIIFNKPVTIIVIFPGKVKSYQIKKLQPVAVLSKNNIGNNEMSLLYRDTGENLRNAYGIILCAAGTSLATKKIVMRTTSKSYVKKEGKFNRNYRIIYNYVDINNDNYDEIIFKREYEVTKNKNKHIYDEFSTNTSTGLMLYKKYWYFSSQWWNGPDGIDGY